MVLTTSALVVAALVPLIPSYLGGRLGELMDIFYNLATIRATHTLGKGGGGGGSMGMFHTSPTFTENVPSQLYPHLDAAVYYLFIQLYSLFPINLVHSLQQKVQVPIHLHNFQEHIAVSHSPVLICHHYMLSLYPTLAPPPDLTLAPPPDHFCSLSSVMFSSTHT